MRFSSLASAALFAALTAGAAPARADDAEAFFAQGRVLRGEGKCAEAIVAFRRAFELKPLGLGALRNVAECEESLGQLASARANWWSLRRAVLQANEPKYEGWDRHAEEAYRRLESKVGRITVKITGAPAERVRITIDGKPLDPRLVGVSLERDLGPHTIEASYGGATPLVEKRTIAAGASEEVTFAIPVPKGGDGPPPGGPPAVPADTGGNRSMRAAGIALVSLGGLAVVGTVVSVALRQSALASFDVCAPSYMGCPPSLRGELTKGQTASTLAFVFGAAAVAGLGAGIPLVVVGSRSPAPEGAKAARIELGVVPVAGGAVAAAGGRF